MSENAMAPTETEKTEREVFSDAPSVTLVAPCVKNPPILRVENLSVIIQRTSILDNINLEVPPCTVFGLVGPSGAGKSTVLRCLNRMVDLTPDIRVTGRICFNGQNIFSPSVDGDILRTRIGMIFQQPVVFPTDIKRNILFGAQRLRRMSRREGDELMEKMLLEVSLWDEVKDRLRDSALRLSVGQQQRLCLARTLATDPDIILMDEPTSALDARSAEAIESLILRLKANRTVILVTHNLGQARRITDWVACICRSDLTGAGQMLESACCDAFFESETCHRVFHTLADDQ